MITSHPFATLESDKFRYVIEPLDSDGNLSLISSLRSIVQRTNTSWREFADFVGLKTTNEAFCAVYGSRLNYKNIKLRDKIRLLYVVDKAGNKAYLYDKNHAPDVVLPTPLAPSLQSTDDATQTVVDKIPVHVLSRTSIKHYDNQKFMSLSIKPEGGYIYLPGSIPADVNVAVVYDSKTIKTLNNILKDVYFVGDGVKDNGSVTVSITDPATKQTSSKKIVIKVTENKNIPAPSISLPQGAKLNLGKFTPVKGISVSEKNDRVVRVIVTPFNARMSVSNLINPIPPRGVYDLTGTPEKINTYLESIAIYTEDKTAQLGVKIRCANVEKLEYLKFTYADAVKPKLKLTTKSVEGVPGTEKAVTMSFEGDVENEFEVSLKPENCKLKGFKTKPAVTDQEYKFTGTIAKINEELAGVKVVVGNASGKVVVTHPAGAENITVTTTPSAVPTLTANDLSGTTGTQVALGAALSTEGVYADQSLTVTATECTIKGLTGEDITSGKNTVINGKVAQINAKLAAAKVVIGSKAGTIKFDWNNGASTKSIKVNVTAAPAAK